MSVLLRSLRNLPATRATVSETVDQILSVRQITRADQQVFLSALLSENSLSEAEQVLINKVLDQLRKGLLRVVD